MDKKQKLMACLLVASLIFTVGASCLLEAVKAEDAFQVSMPEEYLNYTITMENGSFWAKIDGRYPMHLESTNESEPSLMVYPTPPNTTNLHVYLDGSELNWGNYSEINPEALHYTDIGNWQMIYTVIDPEAADFVLAIHYEHPVQVINGTYTFLYDLNISPYLTETNPKSTAHFSIRIEANYSHANVYTTGLTGTWSPFPFNSTQDGNVQTLKFDVVSEYSKPLWGDIAITLTSPQGPILPVWIIILLAILATIIAAVLLAKTQRKRPKHTFDNKY